MARVSRRGALAAFGTAAAAAVGGCSAYLPGGEEAELPDFASWLPADPLESDANPTVTVEHFRSFEGVLPRGHSRYQEYVRLRDQYAIPIHQFDGRVFVDSESALATVLTGSFGRDRVFDESKYSEDQLEHYDDDFVRFGANQAAGPGAFVLSSRPERYVEARLEERPRLVEADDRWDGAARDVATADLVRIVAPSGNPHEVLALAVDVQAGPAFEGTAYAYYESADAADFHADSLQDHVAATVEEGASPVVLDSRRDGALVEVDVGFDNIPF